MNAVFGVFGKIGHALKVGAVDAWHVIEVIGHDADVLFIDTLKAAQLLGFSKTDLLHAVGKAAQSLTMYVDGKEPGWTQDVVQTLQHEFVTSSLVEQLGMQAPVANTLSVIVSKLFAAGSSKLDALVAAGTAHIEAQAGLTDAVPQQ